jgi:hypothetical protein
MPKVLIVEDGLLIADCTEEFLVRSGYEVCGIARTVDEAVDLGRRRRLHRQAIQFRRSCSQSGNRHRSRHHRQGFAAVSTRVPHAAPATQCRPCTPRIRKPRLTPG